MGSNGTTSLYITGERVDGTHFTLELHAGTPAHRCASTTGHCEIIG